MNREERGRGEWIGKRDKDASRSMEYICSQRKKCIWPVSTTFHVFFLHTNGIQRETEEETANVRQQDLNGYPRLKGRTQHKKRG